MAPIIEIKNIGKKYNITHQRGGYIALRDVLTSIAKSPFQFLKHKAKQVAGMEIKEEFWALKDVSFEVQKGEVIGIIGSNGAGKSTLLKILSQITPPTTGEIRINGRVGSLLEVGTGFHPELTGRENIMLNGAILGMKKREIIKKFDAIVEFAGIDKFLDTPVKYYSSGMYVRLAFSVAAHMEPDILIVDEVLAVGDAEFQKKCLGKMEEVTKTEGRTILFVSHNMAAVKRLCTRCVLLNKGKIESIGDNEQIINKYLKVLNYSIKNTPLIEKPRSTKATLRAKIVDIKMRQQDSNVEAEVSDNSPSFIKIIIESYHDDIDTSLQLIISDTTQNLSILDSASMMNRFFKLKKGLNEIICKIDSLNLYSGDYIISCHLTIPNIEIIDLVNDAYIFTVKKFDPYNIGSDIKKDSGNGVFHIDHEWNFSNK